ncbi:unnamed protein product [Parnassius mnemosyne]|uniref:Reverse transcriptase domain-containing protein n=1 Tax=Parnassius mnemosyne TaxID=213953 RepID=A0AAV1KYX1_9NEOP
MEDYRTASKLIPRNGYMATIDLREAYLLVSIKSSHRKFLRFQFEDENLVKTLYEFNAMPYGLSIAPRTFSKIMKEVITNLRSRGYKSVIYLDDILCIGKDYKECLDNVNETMRLLQCLGFVINYNKSCLGPHISCKYLGFIFDSTELSISLPIDKQNHIAHLVQRFSCLTSCSIRDFAHLIGVLTAACPGVKYGWLYTKLLERQKYLAILKYKTYNKNIQLSKDILPDLQWWRKNVFSTKTSFRITKYNYEIFTDACLTGWGACCNNIRVGGRWKYNELEYHINYLELLAIFLGIKCFVRDMSDCNILLRVDNTTAISYINRMGGIQFPHLNELSRSIWQWCEKRNIWLHASYINSKENFEADQESRKLNLDTEWELSDNAYKEIVQKLGEPEIDLFASRANAKCRTYVSWRPDPDALLVDAFTIDWKNKYFYAFPPFSLIIKCLEKITSDKAEGILVFPYWPSQPWYPMLNNLLRSDILFFKPHKNLLRSSSRTPHHLHKQLTLGAARLSGSHL